jgi:hypothetical protein
MRIRNQKDFRAGVMFVAFGLFFAGFGATYSIGTAANMGPGYFPTALGVIVILLAIAILLKSLAPSAPAETAEPLYWRVLALILGPVVLFGLLLDFIGLIAALVVLIAIACYASHEFSWKATLATAGVLLAACLTVFVWGLKLQFQLWPAFIGN